MLVNMCLLQDDAQVMGELERLLARLYSSECTNEERAEISESATTCTVRALLLGI